MKRLFLLPIALTFLAISSPVASACQCRKPLPVCAQYWSSDAVFVGQLREITPPVIPSTPSLPIATLHFIVEESFRGVTTPTIDVGVLSGTSCDSRFDKGTRYLIYASRDPKTNQLFSGPCGRTDTAEHAADDLNYLRRVNTQGVPESLQGQVGSSFDKPIRGVKIEVRLGDKTSETTADENGHYELTLPGPGSYSVKVLVPAAVTVLATRDDLLQSIKITDKLTTIEYEVQLSKSQCDFRDFELMEVDLHATALLSGSVVTTSGRPLDKGTVYLVKRPDDSSRFRYANIEANGSFKFEDVPVGEYYLALNPDNEAPDESDPPYPRTLYPNAKDYAGATRIVVTEGAKLENLNLTVGPAWKAKTVEGTVVWKTGGAAPKASVALYNGKNYVRRIKVDEKGRFSFKIYGIFEYAIEAEVFGQRDGRSQRIQLPENSTNLKLELTPQ